MVFCASTKFTDTLFIAEAASDFKQSVTKKNALLSTALYKSTRGADASVCSLGSALCQAMWTTGLLSIFTLY